MDLLPEDCWELICKAIEEDDYRFLESVSLVSTLFLSITNRVRSTFVVTDRNFPLLHRHLLRFRSLKTIRFFKVSQDPSSILSKVSRSGLRFESVDVSGMQYFPDFGESGMKTMISNVKELICSEVLGFRDSDLVSIGVNFPFLQNLDISNNIRVSDSGFISLSSNLKNLLRINVSGNSFITDKSLAALSQNCVLLREVIFRDCDFISSDCIKLVLHNSRNLESLAIERIGLKPRASFSKDAFLPARCLTVLNLSDSFLPSGLPYLIADAKLPLKKLILSHCQGISFDGIYYLLSKYQTLAHLNLQGSSFLSDEMIMGLRMFLRNLTFVNLSFCNLTGLAFFAVIEKCISLKCMIMEGTRFGVEEYSKERDIKSGLRFLYLSRNHKLRDECLEKISRHCPFLKSLDVALCPNITSDGILEVLRNCGELSSLDVSRCTGIKSLGGVIDFELPRLESFRACGTLIDDETLEMMSRRCRGLLHIDLQGCMNVSSRGVKEIVRCCIRLREIYLKYCEADKGISTWMVFANPSLRKIVPPCGFTPSEKLKNFLLRHGCVISYDSSELNSIAYRANGRDADTFTKLII